MISQHQVKEILEYDPSTGNFYWRISPSSKIKSGTLAGGVHEGYWRVTFCQQKYPSHRLAFLYMTGSMPLMVDHIDGNGLNNKWDNLREADYQQNQYNRTKTSRNTSGYKGVTSDRKYWKAQIMVNQKQIHLGLFDSPEEASQAYQNAARLYHGEFYRE